MVTCTLSVADFGHRFVQIDVHHVVREIALLDVGQIFARILFERLDEDAVFRDLTERFDDRPNTRLPCRSDTRRRVAANESTRTS